MERSLRVQQAFLNLVFAIKVMSYIELNRVDKDQFDCETLVKLPTAEIRLPANSFHTYNDLILAAQNGFHVAVAMTTIAMDSAFNDAGIKPNPNSSTPDDEIRNLVYMARSSFAHDMMFPKWEVRGQFARVFDPKISTLPKGIDLSSRHGTAFEIGDLGGFEGYLEIKDRVISLVGGE